MLSRTSLSDAPVMYDGVPLWLKATEPKSPQVMITSKTKKSERLVPRDIVPRDMNILGCLSFLGSDSGKTGLSITLRASELYVHFTLTLTFRNQFGPCSSQQSVFA